MSRLPPWVLVLAVWAAIYLPALGSFEIKSEEGRRILPGIAMLESGNYVVPQIGSDTYFSKPPLINWLIAASFKISGVRSEWTARLPSVLAILAVAVALITVGRAGLGRGGATIAALIWLTTAGLIEKGRLIEIEAVYVSLSALAIICWLSWWLSNKSPWITWVVPWIWLGLGWLAKGPAHLIFFYAVVLAVLWKMKRLKALFHPAHFVGIILMLGIFAAWAIPFLQMSNQSRALTKWSAQFTGRVTPHFFNIGSALFTLLRAILQLLPWMILLPFLRFSRFQEATDQQLAKGLAWAMVVPLVLVSLMPSSAARYSLPAAAPFCWLVALAFARDAFVPVPIAGKGEQAMWRRVGLPIALIVAFCAAMAFLMMSQLPNKRDKVKTVAAEVNGQVPQDEILYAVNSRYQPFLFYVRAQVNAVEDLDQIPGTAHYFFVRSNLEEEARKSEQWAPRHPILVSRITDYRNETIVLYRIE